MTKSTITREQLLEIIETDHVQCGEASYLARMALAAMDSEPDCKERKLFCSTDTARMRKAISVSAGTKVAPIYHHAQQPVVPDNRAITVVLKYTSEPNTFAPWVAKAFYQFHKDTVDSCVKAFSEACNESNIKLEIIYK
ncbi:hypothetical protein EPNKCIFM_00098 [Klebsiella phage KP13-16]|nr:hypothetical protein EPNKCIFM_00098 [Klebsiella phage KP13-16]